jgi:hypothetical protein
MKSEVWRAWLLTGTLAVGCAPAATRPAPAPAPTADAARVVAPTPPDAVPPALPPDAAAQPPAAPPPDATAGAPAIDATAPPPGDNSPPPPSSAFTCNLVLGTNQTEEWFPTFETIVDGGKWELMHSHSAFVELWADPGNGVWNDPIGSRCTQNATMPDRVIFLALAGGPNGGLSEYSLEKWLPILDADIKSIQTHYPSAKRIELMTYVRGPSNGTCPGAPEYRTHIFPSQDQAMAMMAAKYAGLVFVAPQWAARSCGDFAGNPPHSNAAGAKAWGTMIGEYYR